MSDRLILSITIVFGVSLVVASTDLYLPSLPSMVRYFGATEGELQYTIAAYLTGTASVPLIYGYLADQRGRRFSVLLGFSLFIVGSFICAFTPDLFILILGRFLQGAGGASVNVTGFAAIKDMYSKQDGARIMAYHGMAISMAPILAPVLGGFVEVHFGWRMNFIILLSAALLVWAFIFFFFKETMDMKTHKPNPNLFHNYFTVLKNMNFIAIALAYPLLFGGAMCFIITVPFYYIQVIGLTPDIFGIYIMVIVFGYPLGAFTNSQLIPRLGLEKTLIGGVFLSMLACLLIAVTYALAPLSPEALTSCFFIYALGMGIVFATSTSMAMDFFPKMAGTASAVLHMFRMGAAALGAYTASLFEPNTLAPLIIVTGVAVMLSLTLSIYSCFKRNH